MKIEEIPTPFYIVYEEKLRRNLELISLSLIHISEPTRPY